MADQTATRIPLEELASLPKFAFVTPSHGGDEVAFYYDETGRFELYTLDLRTREFTQVTHGEAPRGLRAGFSWTRDDRAIVFARDEGGDEHNDLYLLSLASGKVARLNEDPDTQEYAGAVAPDNRTLAVMSNRDGQMNVYALDLVDHRWRRLTHFEAPASAGPWSPDGERLAVASNESSDLKNRDGYLVRRDGSEIVRALHVADGSQDTIADWHPDGRRLAVASDASGTSRAGVLDLDTGEVRWLGREGVEEQPQEFSRDGRLLSVLRNHEAAVVPVVYDVETGDEHALDLPPGVAFGAGFALDDAKLVITHMSATRRPELVLYDLATDAYEVLLAPDYGSIDPALFVDHEYVRYPTFDGGTVPALLYTPADADPDRPGPALVMVHGGPTAQYFRGFDPYAQFLTSRGYVVLQPNVRGSTGYGTSWRDANLRDWGGGDLEDVAAGAEYLATLPVVDPERIGVFGGSFGGFMSYLAVVKKPELFKVGVPWIGITDLHLLFEEDMEHFRYYFRQQMGDPEEDRALWRDRSAVEFADRLRAKLLMVHGVNDPRCPVSQSRVFRDRLVELGYVEGRGEGDDFEYHELDGEGHGPSGDIQGTIRTYRLIADFLERRL